jgi:VanZ family protein
MPLSDSTRRWLALAAIVVYWLLLFVLTHLPGEDRPQAEQWEIPHLDKLVHAMAFAGLAALASVAVASFRTVTWPVFVGIAATLALYAAMDELTQGLVRFRVPDYRDWVADIVGIVAGCFLFWIVQRALVRGADAAVTAGAAK